MLMIGIRQFITRQSFPNPDSSKFSTVKILRHTVLNSSDQQGNVWLPQKHIWINSLVTVFAEKLVYWYNFINAKDLFKMPNMHFK